MVSLTILEYLVPQAPQGGKISNFRLPKPLPTQKTAIFRPFLVFLGLEKASEGHFGAILGSYRESSGPKTSSRSIYLAKDAKGAKKRLRCPKPLGELGALCERNSSARMSGPAGSMSGANSRIPFAFIGDSRQVLSGRAQFGRPGRRFSDLGGSNELRFAAAGRRQGAASVLRVRMADSDFL